MIYMDQPVHPEEKFQDSLTAIELRLEAQNRELATLLSVQQAITSHLDRQQGPATVMQLPPHY